MNFSDPRLQKLDGFRVEIDPERERADIVLDRPPLNVIEMGERDQLRLVFETLDDDARVRVIVLRAVGEHFSSGGNIAGFLAASPEHVSKLAWNIAEELRLADGDDTVLRFELLDIVTEAPRATLDVPRAAFDAAANDPAPWEPVRTLIAGGLFIDERRALFATADADG